MPYSHAGEIGDVWKHLPLCEILAIERPKRYFETNSACAQYVLPRSSLKEYGVFHLLSKASADLVNESRYFRILKGVDIKKSRIYFGSPAQAMTILSHEAEYFFHDIEEPPLKDIQDFAASIGLREKVTTVLGDSIAAFLDGGYLFTCGDLVLIDPYQPFDRNASGQNFFDVFIKAYRSNAKTILWYGYDDLKSKKAIHSELRRIAQEYPGGRIDTFDIGQSCMEEESCAVNPGVPGCGLAMANLSRPSIEKTREMLCDIEKIYKNVLFNGVETSISIDTSIL